MFNNSNSIDMQDTENANEWINWIEEAIAKKHIKYYESDHFSNIREIGSGAFGKVFRANWKNSEQHLALKSFFNFNKDTIKEIVYEVIMKIHNSFGLRYIYCNIFFFLF